MRRIIQKFLPRHEAINNNRWLAPFKASLLHPRLWHINRHSAAGAVAAGLFCGLIPGPLQMLGAAVCALIFRVNLPLAMLTTFYTNPLTIVPLYLVAFAIGHAVLGNGDGHFVAPPEMNGLSLPEWLHAMADWMAGLGAPLALGLLMLASGLALTGYICVKVAWRIWLIRTWRQRHPRAPA
jgi:uncharacterized protein (DUF2062 family)